MDTHFGALFRGSTRSIVSCHGKPASAMMQPFTAVGLELRGQQDSVAAGLQRFVLPEIIPDYMSSRGHVQAKKQVLFNVAPQVRDFQAPVLQGHLVMVRESGSLGLRACLHVSRDRPENPCFTRICVSDENQQVADAYPSMCDSGDKLHMVCPMQWRKRHGLHVSWHSCIGNLVFSSCS
jgi:hypothetical protein